MSGGHFDYHHHQMEDDADKIQKLIKDNMLTDEYGFCPNFSKATLGRFAVAEMTLRDAAKMLYSVDMLISSDIGEEEFVKEWEEIVRCPTQLEL